MEDTHACSAAIGGVLKDLRRWTQKSNAAIDEKALLASSRLAVEDFQRLAPGADPAWLLAAWVVRGTRDNLQGDAMLAPRVENLLHCLLHLVFHHADDDLWQQPQWVDVWDTLLFHWQSWYPGLGSAGDKFLARCDELLQQLEANLGNAAACQTAIGQFNQQADRELDRAARLAGRINELEQGQLKVQQAAHQVETSLNQWMAGCSLPDAIYQYIHQSIGPALRYFLINEQHKQWDFWAEMLQQLCRAFEPNKTLEAQTMLHRTAPQLTASLSAAETPATCDPEAYNQFVSDVVLGIDALLLGNTLDTVIAPPIAQKREPLKVRGHRRDGEPHQLECGDWLIFHSPLEGQLRCQYLLQSPVSGELMFVNRQGHKVMQLSVGKFLEALDRRDAQPMVNIRVYSTAVNKATSRLRYYHGDIKAECELQEVLAQQKREREEQVRIESERILAARRQADALARQQALAAEQARHEALKRSREAAERQAREALQEQRRQSALAQIDKLQVGAFADIPLGEPERERCHLGMIMPSTQKYLFYDKFQRKVAEWRRDELAQLLMEGRVELYDAAPGFESRLEQIVFGQRRSPV
ncbi:DUF1631 family protein [Gilvimarinus chinensis]|uniref:DUF1631 family protein n=1 Tax=Gilvimarinus chinensis TaxID=396005 RepID=UPI00037ED596|nr:DUF1631 family protein [Gilvimarinus chinensis]